MPENGYKSLEGCAGAALKTCILGSDDLGKIDLKRIKRKHSRLKEKHTAGIGYVRLDIGIFLKHARR